MSDGSDINASDVTAGEAVSSEAPPAAAADSLTAPQSSVPAQSPTAPTRIPLSALRVRLDDGSKRARWSVNPDGVVGRALVQSAGSVVTVPLRLGGAARFSARVRLLAHDWRDRFGSVWAWLAVIGADGTQRALWSGSLSAAACDKGGPSGLPVSVELPASSRALQLGIDPRGSGASPLVGRAVWVKPEIADPGGTFRSDPRPTAPTAPSPSRPAPSAEPLISVLTPVHDPPLWMLEEAIVSVRSQTFTNWELCLVDDGSIQPEIIGALRRHAAEDARIHLLRREHAGGISVATNAALTVATGRYIALLDHDDTLAHDALQRVADQIAADPDLDMLYSDEDIVTDGRRIWLHLKPGWSPDTLRTNGYTCHLGVYRRELVSDIGGFRSEFDGSQDVDMILRLVERTDRIAHIPQTLYHWHVHAGSTAGGDAKPYAYVAARNAIAAHLERCGIDADVGYGPPGLYRVAHRVDPNRSIALVLAVRDKHGLVEAARSWLAQPHLAWSIVLAAPERSLALCTDVLRAAGVDDGRVTTVPFKDGRDPATGLNAAAAIAEADHLLLMQAPAVGLTHDWLTRLIGYSNQAQIAAAGPIVLSLDGRISEAGIALPDGIPLHLLHGSRSSMDKLFGYGTSVFNVSAVSGILATRRDTFHRLGGLNPEFRELALIDYCLRAEGTDQRVVIVPDARLRTTSPDVAVNDLPAIWRLRERWAHAHSGDRYYNPNYRADRGDFVPDQA